MINTSPNMFQMQLGGIKSFIEFKKYNLIGDVLEFGTFTGKSTRNLAQNFPDKKIFTIDHFEGLEETQKGKPENSDWDKGAFSIYNPLYAHMSDVPKSIEGLKKTFEPFSNIELIVEDVHKLKFPSSYNIGQVAICNIDVDIYEPTVSSLEFLSRCVWNEVFIRFDDWHGNEPEFDNHERLAFTEWINKHSYQFEITHGGFIGGVYVKR